MVYWQFRIIIQWRERLGCSVHRKSRPHISALLRMTEGEKRPGKPWNKVSSQTKETFVWLAVENCSIQFSNRALWYKQRWLSKRWFQPVLLRSFYIASASWRWSFKLKLTGKDSARGILVGGKFSFVTLFVSSPFSLLGKATPLKLLRVSFYTL